MTYLLPKYYVISDNLLHSHDEEASDATTTYGKEKGIFIHELYPTTSTLRIKFDLKSSSGVVSAYARIYKNGSPVGTERITTETSYQTYSEDISFSDGDELELHIKSGTIFEDIYVRNFRVYGDILTQTFNGFLGENTG